MQPKSCFIRLVIDGIFLVFLAHPAAGQIKNAENLPDFPRCISRCSGRNPPA